MTIEVAGVPGQYTAQYSSDATSIFGEDGYLSLTFSGGYDHGAAGMAFDKSGGSQLTLGPVFGDQMIAYLVVDEPEGSQEGASEQSFTLLRQ